MMFECQPSPRPSLDNGRGKNYPAREWENGSEFYFCTV
jgi:hypothetical protein